MWNEIFGALAILGMVVFCVVLIPATPKLVDAVCERIRYGVQNPGRGESAESEQEPAPVTPAAAATQRSTKPAAAATSSKTPADPAIQPAGRVRGTAAAA